MDALDTECDSLLGSAGCQPAAFGNLPNAFRNAKSEAETDLFAANCRELQAPAVAGCSPEPGCPLYPEVGVCAWAEPEDSRGATGLAFGR
jgi:hypothetical protein